MDRENDIFEQPSKVRNVNYMVNEDAPQRRVRPAQTSDAASQASSARNARQMNQAPTSQASQGQVRRRPVSQDGSDQRVSDGARASQQRPAQARPQQPRPASSDVVRTARPASDVTRTQARPAQARPQQARPASSDAVRTARPASDATRAQARPAQSRPASSDAVRTARPASDATRTQARPQQARPASDATRTQARPASSQRRDYERMSDDYETRPAKTKKKKDGFKKFVIIYSAILVVILVVGLIIFGSFIKKYEENQPINLITEIVDEIKAGKTEAFLQENAEKIQCLENVENVITQSVAGMEGKQISFIENKDYRADAPSYNITADGSVVAKITLGKSESGAFGLSSWKITGLDVASYLPDTLTYKILTLENSKVSVNGTQLTDDYMIEKAGIPSQLETASKFVTIPNFQTYQISGFTTAPQVSATDSDGNALGVSQTSNSYVCGTTTTQEFINSVSGLVDSAIDAWGRHFINMGGHLSAYIHPDCDYYGYIFGSDTMDPIYTAFYEFESIANYEFTEKSATNYIRYTDSCFTVDVKYQLRVDFYTDYMSDNNQKLDATWVFITQNGGQDWYIVDCIYKS